MNTTQDEPGRAVAAANCDAAARVPGSLLRSAPE